MSLFFTLWLSVFLLAYLDWEALATCTDESTCHDSFDRYVVEKVRGGGRGDMPRGGGGG